MKRVLFVLFICVMFGCTTSIEHDWNRITQSSIHADEAEKILKQVLAHAFIEIEVVGLANEIDREMKHVKNYILAVSLYFNDGFSDQKFTLSAPEIIKLAEEAGYSLSATFAGWDDDTMWLISNSHTPLARISPSNLAMYPPYFDEKFPGRYRYVMPLDVVVRNSVHNAHREFKPQLDWKIEQNDIGYGDPSFDAVEVHVFLVRNKEEFGWSIYTRPGRSVSPQYLQCHDRISSIVESMMLYGADMIYKNDKYQAMKVFTPEELQQAIDEAIKNN